MKRSMAIVAVFSTVLFASCENTFINSILPDRAKTSYTVTFDKNHEDATEAVPPTMKVTSPKTTVDTLPAEPERTGWKFTGWDTKPDGDGTPFTADTPVKRNITVYAQWEENKVFTVVINISGKVEGDSVSLSPSAGEEGATVTITYIVDDTMFNNQITFSGTTVAIDPVNSAGSGTRTYVINGADAAADGCITIDAQFTHNDDFPVVLDISGKVEGDSVTLSPSAGEEGDIVTITYTVDNSAFYNQLVFSGTTVVIDPVNSAGSGTRTYVINRADAAATHIITINAIFTHTDKEIDTIAFADTHNEDKFYGDAPFTKAITNTGVGSGAISYSSGDTSVATVSADGEVKILRVGSSTITATKAADDTYGPAVARYTLTVSALQLTISDPVVTTTKTYDGNKTAAFTIGTLINKVVTDTVTVTAVATYNSEDVETANLITVVYTITGTSESNYIKPVDYPVVGTITKADGAALASAPTGTATSLAAYSSITVTPVTPPANGQTVEYAISTTESTPSTDWQTGISFPKLAPQSEYYIFARSAANANYNAGTARSSAKITVPVFDPTRATIIDFETDAIGKTYEYTRGDNNPSKVAVASDPDPSHNGEKSLQITTGGSPAAWNQAAIIPIHLPYELQNYKSFSFSFYLVSGTSTVDREIMVYAAGNTGTFIRYAFGNPASGQNQFAANLVGQTPNVSFSSTGEWIDYTIINNPGAAIRTLQGDIFIAIGINNDTVLNYYVDDLTFSLKDDFVRTPVMSRETATFDKRTEAREDITVNMTLYDGATLTSIMNGETALGSTDYTVSGNMVTLKKEYFATQPEGTTTLTFVFSKGAASKTLTVTVVDTTPRSTISPQTAIFDKKAPANIPVTLTLHGTLSSIMNGTDTLTNGTDYDITDDTAVTLKKEYFSARPVGTTTLTFVFSDVSRTLTVNVRDGGTSFDFTTLTEIDVAYTTGTVAINATIVQDSADSTKNVLRVQKEGGTSYTTRGFVLTFSLGNKTLNDFTGLTFRIRGAGGDLGSKNIIISILNDDNTTTTLVSTFQINFSTTWQEFTNRQFASGVPLTKGGDVKIAFMLNNTQENAIEFSKIELVPK